MSKRRINPWILISLIILCQCALFACRRAYVEPIPDQTMAFEAGMRALAANLGQQLDNAVSGRGVNKITIDPFIDVESGYAVKANETIRKVMSEEIKTRFQISGAMEPDNLEASAYVLNGMVTLEREPGTKGHRYKVSSAVFEKASGRVLASSSVRVSEFDTTPMDIYKDSPVFLKGENYEQLTTSVKKAPEENVEKGYHDRLAIKSMQVKGDLLYEEKEYNKSFAYYDQAARSQDGLHLEVLNGQFTSSLKQGEWERAEAVYAKLIRSSIAETGELATKITFNPSSASPIEGKARIHNIYIRQIAKMVASTPNCRIAIIGHSSKTGKEGFNDSLSLSRSKWILKEMAGYAHDITQRAETIGRGYRENIVGTGADNLTDEIDRRVEFKFSQCGQ